MGALISRKPRNEHQHPLLDPINKQNLDSVSNTLIINNQPTRASQNLKNYSGPQRSQSRLESQMELDERKYKKQQKWYEKVYFTPQSKFILAFKTVTLALIYLYFLQIPITIAFEKHRDSEESQRFFQIINVPAIVLLVIGVLIKMKTGFYKEGILIEDQKKIIINYFLYLFVFDFLSITSIVIYEFSQILRDKSSDPIAYRYIVIFFYLKIPQVFSIEKSIISSFDLNRRIKAFFKLALLMTKIFMLCNIASCGFFYISDNTCPMDAECQDCCWIYQLQILGHPLKDAQWVVQYAFSLYWASTTMLTIGYGDITPQNLSQAVYTVSAQFISCVLFAFSINEIWSIIQQKNAKRSKIHSRMNVINVYMRDKNVGPEIKSRVNAYLSHFYHTKNLREKQLEHEIISDLTPSLRKELYFQSYGFLFHTHSFFKNFSQQFLQRVSQHIRQVGFFEQQIVYSPTSQQQLSLYYIHKGQLESYIELGNSRTRNIMLQQLQKGSIIGLVEFLTQLNYCSSLMALKYSLLYVLDYENWMKCIKEYEEDYEGFFVMKHNAQYERKMKKLKLECMLCGSGRHQSDRCLQEEIVKSTSEFLTNYLRKAERKPYLRRNFKTQIELKSQGFSLEPTSPIRYQRYRKNSMALRKESLKNQSTKKSIFQKKTHHQKMNKIIEKRMRQSAWSQQSESDDQIITEVMMMIDSVQNYQYYWPAMNATTTDWGKERRRQTFNRMVFKT